MVLFQIDQYYPEKRNEFLHTDYDRYLAGENCTFEGPGHGTPIQLDNGDWWYIYHAWR